MMILVTLAAADATYRWSTGAGYIDADGQVYEPRVIDAGNFERSLVRRGDVFGRSDVGFGEVRINNADGALDTLLTDAIDGRDLTIKYVDGVIILVGTVGGARFRRREIELQIRDRQAVLADRLIVDATFAGDNALPAGLEGTDDNIGGEPKPRTFGKLRNVPMPMVNTSRTILQISTVGPVTVSGVDVGGAAVTASTDYPDLATLESAAPSAGQYRVYLGTATEGAYVRLGSVPTLPITADLDATDTVADIMDALLRIGGAVSVDGVSAVNGVAGWVAGFLAQSGREVTIGEALDALAQSVHGYWIATRTGDFRIGLIREPAAVADATIDEWQILEDGTAIERTFDDRDGLPVYRVTVEYQRLWRPLGKSETAGVALVDQEYLESEYRTVTREDLAIRIRHPLAKELTVRTVLDAKADAEDLRDTLFGLYSVQRDRFDVAVAADQLPTVDIGQTVTLTASRFGLEAGRNMVVLARTDELSRNRTIFTLWG